MNNGDSNFGVSTNILSVQYTQKYIVEMIVIREYAFSADDAVGSRDSPRESSPEGRDAI